MSDAVSGPLNGWKETTLGECADWYSGGTPRTSVQEYWNGDIPWITASSLHDFYLRNSVRRVTQLGLENGTRLMPRDTVIFVVRGMSLKSEFRVGIARRSMAFGQDCKAIVAHDDVNPLYLANLLRAKQPEVLSLVSEASHGTGRLETDALKRLKLQLPPLPTQRRIAEILGRLDDKIEVNRRINRTLESMAQALYKHWFVDFGPFQEGEFMESDLGLIPAGWAVGRVYNSAQFINGAAYRKFNPNREGIGLPIIKIAELKNGVTNSTLHSEEDIDEKYHIGDGDILFSWSGNPDTSLDVFTWTGGHALLNQHIFLVKTQQPEERYFVYFMLKHLMPTFAEIARNKQTTGLGHVTVRDLKEMPVVHPPRDVLNRFARYAGKLFELRFGRLLESRNLVATRDYLLPKLLSGEVEINL